MFESGKSIHELWDTFRTELLQAINENVPSKMFKTNTATPWIRGKAKRVLRRKARVYRRARKTKNWSHYRKCQRDCKRELRKAEWAYINNTINDSLKQNNSKPFWKYVKSKKEDNIGVSPLKSGNHLVTDGKGKAEKLIDQFQSVFTKDDGSSVPSFPTRVKDHIPSLTINKNGVTKLLKNIKVSKAAGPDGLPNRVLQECASEISPALTAIFQKSVDSGELPRDWRNANIAPVFKKGDKHLPENYRPVSLTCVASKLLEHIICRHLLDHLDKHNVLTSLNHGFRAGYSCETQLVVTAHDLLESFDSDTQADVLVLDFSKAFDTVPHRKLLSKLEAYGIHGPILHWIENFLTQRKMSVVVEGESSHEVDVESGVPQGTVLGPLLFLCHINDMPECVQSQIRLFADDCLLYRPIRNFGDHTKLQQDLNNLNIWANKWGMKFNVKKCYHLSVRQKSSNFYTMNGHILQQVAEIPYLGITFSDNMKWTTHINQVRKKANSTLGFLRRNLHHTPQTCRKNAYLALVRSKMEYGSVIWDPYTKNDIAKLENVQRSAARFIMKDYHSRQEGCVTEMLISLRLPTLQDRRRDQRLSLMYKVVEGHVPAINKDDYIQPQRQRRAIRATWFKDYEHKNIVENYSTNNSKCYKPIPAKTENFKNSFFVRTIYDWNKLDDSVINSDSVNSFRNRLSTSHFD